MKQPTETNPWFAWTNGTDTLVGPSLSEAISDYIEYSGCDPSECPEDEFRILNNEKLLMVMIEDENGNPHMKTKRIHEWIAEHVNSGNHRSLMFSSER